MTDARDAAFLSLWKCEKQKKYTNLETDASIKKYSLTGPEKNLYVSLVYGVTERRITLDFLIDALPSRKTSKLEPGVLIPLRLGLYQLIFADKIPESAAVNESVKLTKKYAGQSAGGFTNAVLRSFLRSTGKESRKDVDLIMSSKPFAEKYSKLSAYEKLSVLYSYPEWLCQMLADSYGCGEAKSILAAENTAGRFTLRVNTLKTTADKLIKILSDRGLMPEGTRFSPFGIDINGASVEDVSDIIEDGLAFVQDEASQIASVVLGARGGESVIDCCACPGGKSFSSAMLMENRGKILSCDLHKSKLSLIESGAERLGIKIIEAKESDSSVFNPSILPNSADRVLCDVPCSGLGVISKKPEIRYKKPDDINKLPGLQYKILENCSRYVKDGGILLYSTCTLNPDENVRNVKKFIEAHPEFSALDFEVPCSGGEALKSTGGMITLFPHINKTDGFFIAKMIKKDNG